MADEESLKFRVRFIGIQKSVADKYKKLIGATAEEIAALSRQPTSKLTREYKLPVSLKRKVKPAIARFQLGALQLTEAEVRRAWEIANKKDDAILSAYLQTLQKHPGFFNHNLDALEAWLRRGHGELSDNVWQVSDQLRQEMETQLALGIANGDSAATIARRMKRYLVNPDALFRRVRDENGKLIQSRAMKAFHPGQGVYKSAYKNALRLTRTEMNRAYMLADHMRWKSLPMVTGFRISLSAQHPDYDYPEICEVLQGEYPKAFKFAGWHPQCLCHMTPILMPEKDFRAYLQGKGDLKPAQSKKLPDQFVKFTKENMRRFLGYNTVPYWMQDNADIILNTIGGDMADWPTEGYFLEDMIEKAGDLPAVRDVLWGAGYHVSDSIVRLESESMKEALAEIVKLKNMYDETLWRITTIDDPSLSLGVYARANGTEIQFSSTVFDAPKEYIEGLVKGDVAKGYHPEGCFTIKSIIDHEFAHVLTLGDLRRVEILPVDERDVILRGQSREAMVYNSIKKTFREYMNHIGDIDGKITQIMVDYRETLVRPGMSWTEMRDAALADEHYVLYRMWDDNDFRGMMKYIDAHELPDVFSGLGLKVAHRLKFFISDYAKKDIYEFAAEAFTMAINSPNPSKYASMIKRIIDDHYLSPPLPL